MILKLANFILNQGGSIRSEEMSRLANDATQDVAALYVEQQRVSGLLSTALLAATADNNCLATKLATMSAQLTAMTSAYTDAADTGVVYHLAYHSASSVVSQPASLTNCEWSSIYGQVTLATKPAARINRVPLYLNDDGSQAVASSATVSMSWDGGSTVYTDRNAGPFLAMLPDAKYVWAETLTVPGYEVTVGVPNIRGAGANMISIVPVPVLGTEFTYVGYLSTAGVYVPITTAPITGPTRLYFAGNSFGNSIRFSATSTGTPGSYVVGMYKFGLAQESFHPSGQFVVKLSEFTRPVSAITSFEVDYDMLGIDPSLNMAEYASFQLWAGGPLSIDGLPTLTRPLDVPLGLTKDMPPTVVTTSGDVVRHLYLVGSLKSYSGTTPVYKSCKVTYIE